MGNATLPNGKVMDATASIIRTRKREEASSEAEGVTFHT